MYMYVSMLFMKPPCESFNLFYRVWKICIHIVCFHPNVEMAHKLSIHNPF